MEEFAVTLYRQRREERLAARGIKIRKKQYRKSKDLRRIDTPAVVPSYHNDAPDGEEEQQNNRRGRSSGGHGNTKLPFGLCKKYGIEIGEDWTPKDAWDALAGKGITPGEIYKKLKAGEELGPDELPEPPKKDPVKTIEGHDGRYYYTGIKARRGWASRGASPWVLEGTPEWKEEIPESERHGYRSSWLGRFATLTDMYLYLKKHGVEEFEDPETGEVVNPAEMELPKVVYTDGERGYSSITIGMKKDRYAIVGTDFEGKKKTIEDFPTLDRAYKWMEARGVSADDAKLSPALKKREAERLSWLTSDKREYVEIDGVRYGDLRLRRDYYGRLILSGESESGEMIEKVFKSRTDAIAFAKNQGVEKLRDEDKTVINPTEEEIPEAIAEVEGQSYQKLWLQMTSSGSLALYGMDLDGRVKSIGYMSSYETVEGFKERLKSEYSVSEDLYEIQDTAKEYIAARAEEDAIRDRRRKEFPEKAIPVYGGRYMDVRLVKSGGYELKGYDEYGRERRIAYNSDLSMMISAFMDRYHLNPDDVIQDKELRAEYDRIQEFKKDFEQKAVAIGHYKYVGVEVVKEGSEFCLTGYDSDGKRHRITYSGDLYDVAESATSKGVVDIEQYIKDDEVKKDWAEHKKRIAEFESKAKTMTDGSKYADIVLSGTEGDFSVKGYDAKGKLRSITGYGKTMYRVMEEAEKLGIKPDDFKFEDDTVKKAYSDYKKVKEKFDAESKPYSGGRYMDLELTYEDGWYRVKGTDRYGRRKTLDESKSATAIAASIDSDSSKAYSFDTFEKSDSMKDRMTVIQRVKDAVATGEYYDMGVDGEAFKSIHADKIGGKWSIKGVGIDGTEKQIVETADWDETVEMLERFQVKDYKLLTRDRTYDRPKDGMHHVTLMRTTDGMFKVYADSESKGKHAEMHSSTSEEEARNWLRDSNVDTSGLKTRGMNPNDDQPRTHTERSLASFDTYRMKRLDGNFVDDLTEDEKNLAAEMLTTIFSQGAYRVARSTSSFGGIIENGYKSQVETGKGGYGAAHDKDLRKSASKIFYGHSGLEDSEYEKCGYIGFMDEAEDWNDSDHPGYGGSSPLTYTLRKENVQDRTTYTYGDSLNTRRHMTSAGYAGPHPTIEGLSSLYGKDDVQRALRAYQEYKDGSIDYATMFERIRRSANNNYIELQFHGPITIKDIERVSFNKTADLDKAFSKMSDTRKKKVVKLLRENNVDIVYRENRYSKFQNAWEYIRQHWPEAFED